MIAVNWTSGLLIDRAKTLCPEPPPPPPRRNVLNMILRVLKSQLCKPETHLELSTLLEALCSRKQITVGGSDSFFTETALGGQRKLRCLPFSCKNLASHI